jgi:hypothetical protein
MYPLPLYIQPANKLMKLSCQRDSGLQRSIVRRSKFQYKFTPYLPYVNVLRFLLRCMQMPQTSGYQMGFISVL